MKNERMFPCARVTRKAEKSLRGGHPWVFGEEITRVDGEYRNGDIVDVLSDGGKYLGSGFINDHSKIRVRLLSRNANDRYDEAFFARRVRYALEYRRTVMADDFDNCRLIFGEADGLPGLTVDRFGDVLVAQTLSLGIERRKTEIFRAIVQVLSDMGAAVRVLYERNDVAIREKEGMEQGKGYFSLPGLSETGDGHVTIRENGILYDVDYIDGQKTGFFLDQKYNRQAVARLCRGRYVLDCFTHTGAFALNAAAGGAAHVTAVDVSAQAIALARANAERNGLAAHMDFVCADVFDLLTELSRRGNSPYDLIILDPPAFTKSSDTVANATRGYKEINMRAMKLLPRGGYLATCSCSHFMTETLFRHMLHDAAADAGVSLRQVEERRQSPDHPILWNVGETEYLKFYIFQVV